jgi:hypothetical protein
VINNTLLPHSEYSSGVKPLDIQSAEKNSSAKTSAPSNTKSTDQKLQWYDHIISFKKKAKEPEKGAFVVGLFNDVFKNIAKILTGSLLTDTIKALNKNGDLTWQQAIYKTLVDSGPSRILTDVVSTFAVRFLNGNHSFLGLFKLPYIAPELSSQIFALPCVIFSRAMTQGQNVNSISTQDNMSEENKLIEQEIIENNHPFYQLSKWLSKGFGTHIKPYVDSTLSLIGIHAGKPLLDNENKPIYEKKENGEIKTNSKGEPIALESNPQIDMKRLLAVTGGSFIGSFFMPKGTTAFGFEEAKSIPRVLLSILTTSLFRLNTTLLHNGVGMHFNGGANFDACHKASVVEKMLVPFTQYAADAFGTYLSKFIPFMNGASLSNILRMVVEIPATYLSNGILNVAKTDRMSDDWTYLSHRIWKRTSDAIEDITKPLFVTLSKYIYSPMFGMFDPKIPNMYGVDIRPQATQNRDQLSDEIAEKYKSKLGILGDLGFYLTKSAVIPWELKRLFSECGQHSREVEQELKDRVESQNLENLNRKLAEIEAKKNLEKEINLLPAQKALSDSKNKITQMAA